jgi:CHASE3 domain sensor protein
MKRIAVVFSIISVIVLVYGLIDYLTNYNWAQGDQDPLFGNQNVLLNDGATVLIAGGFLTVGSVIMWILALRKGDGDHQP